MTLFKGANITEQTKFFFSKNAEGKEINIYNYKKVQIKNLNKIKWPFELLRSELSSHASIY